MADFFKKHKKKSIFVTFLFLLFFGGWWTFKYKLPKTVEVVVRLILGPTFKSKSIKFEKNRVVIKDFILADGEEVIIDTPEVDILYSKESLKKFRIEEVVINGGTANITRRENGDVNIVAAFTGKSNPQKSSAEEKSQKKEYNPGIGVPIDRITGKDVTTIYRDLGYRLPIEQTAYNTNGYLTFSKSEGIDLHFVGNNGEEIYDYTFNNSKEPYSMTIKLSNIRVKTELAQYGYDGKEVSYEGGKLNMDLVIASSGMLGWIDFNGVAVRYIDLDDPIENLIGRVDFNKEGIFLNAKGEVFNKPEKFALNYVNNELNIDFDLKNIDKKDIEKLSYLDGIELPFEQLNVDKVKFNLNLKKELKITIDALVKKAEMEGLRLEDSKVRLIYDSKGIHLPIISTKLLTLDKKNSVDLIEKIDGKFNFFEKKGELELNIENINGKDYVPNFIGKLDFNILDDEIELDLNSNIVDLKGKYLSKDKKFQLKDEGKYFFEYDIVNKKIKDGRGVIDFNLYDLNLSLDYLIEKQKLKVNNLSIIEEREKRLSLVGDLDLENLTYDFKLFTDSFDIKRKFEGEEVEVKSELSGKVKGEGGTFEGRLDIASLNIKYMGELKNLSGRLKFNNKNGMFFEYEGGIDKLSYKDYSLNGVAIAMRLKDDIFQVRNINNQLFTLVGEYSLEDRNIRGKLETNKLPLERFGLEFPKILLNKVVGEIRGDISNPNVNINISDISIAFKNDEEIKINGKLNYKNGVLLADKVKINQSILNGRYSVADGKYSASLNVIEENIGRYYDFENLKYRVIGLLKVDGEKKNIALDFKSTIDKIYLNGTVFPTVYLEADYKATELINGVARLKKATLSNSELEDLFTLTGEYNVTDNLLDVEIKKQELPLFKLRDYIPIEGLKGSLFISGNLGGKLEDLTYNLDVSGNTIDIKGVIFEDLKFLISGDMKVLRLDEFSFKYLGNNFISRGNYDIVNGGYLYRANSKKINLKFLNSFIDRYGFNILDGEGAINLKLSEVGNSGFIKIEDFNLKNKDFFLKLEEFNSTIRLEDNKISIKKLVGKLNEGDIDIKGEVNLPSLKEISENPYYYENIKYEGNLKLSGIKYKYGDYFKVDFGADIGLHNKEVRGSIDINSGEVSEIPNTSKTIFQKIREFLFSSTSNIVNQSEDLGSDFKIESIIENAPVIDLKIKIDKGIKLDIGSVNAFVEDIKGNVVGNGILSGKDGKYTFIGNTEIIGGSLNINENTFYLDRAIVMFNDNKSYLPKVNPNLLVDARVNVQDEQIGLSLSGVLDNLQFTISSKSGSSSGNLNSLLTDSENMGDSSEATTTLITNVIGAQLTQIVKPISNLVKNTLNISKFRISSNLLSQEIKNSSNSEERNTNTLKLGAILEAEDNIYQDKIWWVAKGTLLEEDNAKSNNRDDSSGALKEYDFSLEYRFNNTKSIGIGVGKLPEERKKSEDRESKQNLNYHIDFKFEKKYDKLIDIFINK